ncbi:MAG: winged helix-turn-helix domain-containing protein, partial [Campylobacterales bacterium]|nr:winged helix-turn-helix domain-containing protein [Campylobacterales bacterium]
MEREYKLPIVLINDIEMEQFRCIIKRDEKFGHKLGNNDKTRVKTRVKILELIEKYPTITNQEIADTLEMTVKGVEWQI